MERPFQEVGGIRQWRLSLRITDRERNGVGFPGRCATALTPAVMARQPPPARVTGVRSCFRSIAAQIALGAASSPFA